MFLTCLDPDNISLKYFMAVPGHPMYLKLLILKGSFNFSEINFLIRTHGAVKLQNTRQKQQQAVKFKIVHIARLTRCSKHNRNVQGLFLCERGYAHSARVPLAPPAHPGYPVPPWVRRELPAGWLGALPPRMAEEGPVNLSPLTYVQNLLTPGPTYPFVSSLSRRFV